MEFPTAADAAAAGVEVRTHGDNVEVSPNTHLPPFGVVVGSRFLSFLYVNYSTLCMEIFFFKEPLL